MATKDILKMDTIVNLILWKLHDGPWQYFHACYKSIPTTTSSQYKNSPVMEACEYAKGEECKSSEPPSLASHCHRFVGMVEDDPPTLVFLEPNEKGKNTYNVLLVRAFTGC